MTAMRRRALAIGLLVLGLLIPTPALGSFGVPITPRIDHTARTITFEGKLYLYPTCDRFYCAITDDILRDVKADIEATWNKGYTFRCYRVVIKAIVEMARSLGVMPVASGVETDDQLQALAEMGCREYQGHHFLPALPAPELERRLLPGKVHALGTRRGRA
jgi:hypothetical protein